ncbi:MAG: hypothetical protein P1U63_08105 [Coxiellaceae bacterium]|nr:hypothetical protein [Coxiellaceae bacterium]
MRPTGDMRVFEDFADRLSPEKLFAPVPGCITSLQDHIPELTSPELPLRRRYAESGADAPVDFNRGRAVDMLPLGKVYYQLAMKNAADQWGFIVTLKRTGADPGDCLFKIKLRLKKSTLTDGYALHISDAELASEYRADYTDDTVTENERTLAKTAMNDYLAQIGYNLLSSFPDVSARSMCDDVSIAMLLAVTPEEREQVLQMHVEADGSFAVNEDAGEDEEPMGLDDAEVGMIFLNNPASDVLQSYRDGVESLVDTYAVRAVGAEPANRYQLMPGPAAAAAPRGIAAPAPLAPLARAGAGVEVGAPPAAGSPVP